MAGSDNNINFGDGVRLEPSDARGHSIMQKSGDDIGLMNVSGDPEGVVPANPGSKAFDRSSGCEYIKVTGTGVTGWERIQSGETVATTYQADSGSAQAAGNILNLSGGTGIDITGAGSTVTFNFDETEVPAIATTYTADSGSATPAANNLNILGGPGVTVTGSGSTLTVNSVVYTDQTGSTSVTADSGSFATNSITLTLPASPEQGERVEIIATNGVVTVTAAGTQVIHIGNDSTTAGGTATGTATGDSVTLIYQSSTDDWWALGAPCGVWVLA